MQRYAKTRHHFVDDQKRAVLRAQAAHCVHEFLRGRNHVHVAGDCLDDYAGDVAAPLLECVFELLRIVVFEYERVFGRTGRNTSRRGVAKCEHARAGLHEQAVAVAVVATFEFDDLIAARVAASQTNGAHAGLRAGTHKAYGFDIGHDLDDFFGNERFALGDGAKRKARVDGGVHGFNHGRMVVAEDHRTPGADVIDVAATFGIPHVGAFGATDKARCTANALESAYGRIHAAGDALLSTFKKFLVDAHFLSNALNQ